MWKEIPCTNGQYSANNETGYEVVDLRLNGKRHKKLVHRLIAETFNKDFDPNLDINHINGIKTDNYASN